MSAEVPPAMAQAAVEWQAAEHAAAARVERQVEQLQAAQTPAAAPQTPEAQQAAQLAQVAEAAMPKLCEVAWRIADRYIAGALGPECHATPDELQQLAALTVPVLNKYLPGGLAAVFNTPEGILLGTAGIIYGSKLLLGAPTPPDAAPPAPPQPAAAPAPSAQVTP